MTHRVFVCRSIIRQWKKEILHIHRIFCVLSVAVQIETKEENDDSE